jgi:hypothetical protein
MLSWDRGDGRQVVGLGLVRVVDRRTQRIMVSYERSSVGLKPTWKANLCFLFLVATIVSASIFALATK